MSHRSRPSDPGRHAAVVLLLASIILLLAPAVPVLANETCFCSPNSADSLVNCLDSTSLPATAVICLEAGTTYTYDGGYENGSYALPAITTTVTIQGNGATIDGSSSIGLFYVNNGDLTLNNVTVQNGRGQGGAIYSTSTLTINTSTFSQNSASGSTGGAIYSTSMLTINTSTFSKNSAGQGGAIYHNGGTLTVNTSTFSGNTASTNGGDIWDQNSVTINTSTFSSANPSGTLYVGGQSVFTSSIFENTSEGGSICNTTISTNSSNNLLNDSSCGSGIGTVATDLGLESLAPNGGPTETMALGKDSAAIGEGSCGQGARDQRCIERKSSCDIGAFERTCQVCSCLNGVCTIYIWIDFENPDEKGYYKIMNEVGCQEDNIPSDTTRVQWKIMPVNGVVGADAGDITVEHITYTPQQQKSRQHASPQQEPRRGAEPSPPETKKPEQGNPVLKPCYFKDAKKVKVKDPATGPNGWVVYYYDNLSQGDISPPGCSQYNQRPGEGKCNCAPPSNSYWWYGVVWSGKVNTGDWDPRMRPDSPGV